MTDTPRKRPAKKAAAKPDPVDRIVQEVSGGRCDDRLIDIATAIGLRIRETAVTFGWRFHLDEVDVSELEVTLGEWERIERACGVPMVAINPEGNLPQTLAVGKVLLETRGGMTADAAAERMESLTVVDMGDLFQTEQRSAPFGSPN